MDEEELQTTNQEEEEDNNEVEEQEGQYQEEEMTEDNDEEQVIEEEEVEEQEDNGENEEEVEEVNDEGEEVGETVDDNNDDENVETLVEEEEDDCMIIESNDTNNIPASNIAKIEPIVRQEQEVIVKDEPEIIEIKTEIENSTTTVQVEENQNVLLAKPDVFIFKIPLYNKRKNPSEFKSSEWNLNDYWNGSFKVIADESYCLLQFFDDENKLYGQSRVEKFPGEKMNKVKDSSRYFVLKLQMQKEEELVGFGFSDRSDSADLIKTLQTYFEVHQVLHTRRAATSHLSNQPPSKKSKPAETKKHAFIMDQSSPIASQLKHFPSKSKIDILPADFVKKGLEMPGKFACDLCNASFDDMRHIKSHWHKIHDIQHPSHCVKCQLPFVSPTEMKAHRLKYHGFRCPDCPDKSFKKAKGLENHYFSVHQKKLGYPCSFPSMCTILFNSTDELKSHLLIHHKNEDLSRILFPCNEKGCKEQFFTHESLVGHQLTHINNIICEFCNESMKTKGALRKHLQVAHPGSAPTRI